ncbi:hypothetical protein FS749_010852 [Ceratobasidium sp. UAMH 11750]|nr:hypothetical protein FS749_010852 [Ceratobasidium sp. UAMH 11750]
MIKHIPSLLFSCAVAVVASPTHTRHVDPKAVFAQVIVGNTYNYTPDQWASDIVLASSKGIDAFTLNVGYEVWQPGQVKSAYDAAARIAPNFKLFISLDMSSLACTSSADAQYIIKGFIAPFRSHSQQYIYNSKVLLSTLAGQECTFGEASASAGWQWLINNAGTPIYFIPNLQLRDPVQLRTMWGFIDGYKLWNARPKTNVDNAQRADDAQWVQNTAGKGHLTLVSPWFFTHALGGNASRA